METKPGRCSQTGTSTHLAHVHWSNGGSNAPPSSNPLFPHQLPRPLRHSIQRSTDCSGKQHLNRRRAPACSGCSHPSRRSPVCSGCRHPNNPRPPPHHFSLLKYQHPNDRRRSERPSFYHRPATWRPRQFDNPQRGLQSGPRTHAWTRIVPRQHAKVVCDDNNGGAS